MSRPESKNQCPTCSRQMPIPKCQVGRQRIHTAEDGPYKGEYHKNNDCPLWEDRGQPGSNPVVKRLPVQERPKEEVSEYRCPHCGKAVKQLIPVMKTIPVQNVKVYEPVVLEEPEDIDVVMGASQDIDQELASMPKPFMTEQDKLDEKKRAIEQKKMEIEKLEGEMIDILPDNKLIKMQIKQDETINLTVTQSEQNGGEVIVPVITSLDWGDSALTDNIKLSSGPVLDPVDVVTRKPQKPYGPRRRSSGNKKGNHNKGVIK